MARLKHEIGAGVGLSEMAADPEPSVCIAAADALDAIAKLRLRIGARRATVPVIPPVEKLDGDKEARLPGAQVKAPPGRQVAPTEDAEAPLSAGLRPAVPSLIGMLAHKEVRVRLAALYALESLGSDAVPAGDSLMKALKDENSFVRWGAVRALGKMAPLPLNKGEPIAEALAPLLADENGDVRLTTAAALRRYGPASTKALPQLIKVLKDGETPLKLLAIEAVLAVGTEAGSAVPALALTLTDREAVVRAAAARALGRFGKLAQPAVPALTKALDDPEGDVRLAAGEALTGIPADK